MPDNRKRRPTHPGAVLREDVLPELGLSRGEFAEALGGCIASSAKSCASAARSARTWRSGWRALSSSPEVWLHLRQEVDIWEARREHGAEYRRIAPLDTL